jgi:plastocyanin
MLRKAGLVASLAATGVLAISSGAVGKGTDTVKVGDNFFRPGELTIKKNDKVAWNWIGAEEHNVTKAKGPGKFFESETTNEPGVNFAKRFKKTGKYKFICTLHGEMQMTLRVK